MCGTEFFNLLKVSTLRFEKVCGSEFFELLKVSTFKFEVCEREVFKLLKTSNFKCVKKNYLSLLQISIEIPSLGKKVF